MYTDVQLRLAWHEAMLSTWKTNIRDIEAGQPDERLWIDAMWRDLGWGDWFLGDDGYNEDPESWCGAGLAWVGRHRIGDFLDPDMCIDVRLDSHVASQILPGTDKMYDRSKWQPVGDGEWPGIEYLGGDGAGASPWQQLPLGPGVIATTGSGADGSHILMIDQVRETDAGIRIDTVECNGWGVLGDGHYGEGIVRRYDAGEVPDYDGELHPVQARTLDEIRCVYPPSRAWFAGLS